MLTKEFLEAGISKKTLNEYLQKGYLGRVAHGVATDDQVDKSSEKAYELLSYLENNE